MSHNRDHIIISAATPLNGSKPEGWKVGHCYALWAVVGGLVGLLVGGAFF